MKRIERQPLRLLAALCLTLLLSFCASAAEVPGDGEYDFDGTEFVSSIPGDLEGIYVCQVPEESVCVLCFGERVIRAGDFLPYASLSALTLRPTANETGSAVFRYQAIQQGNLDEAAVLTMQIRSTRNDPPTAKDMDFETYKNVANEGTFPADDPEGDALSFRIEDKPRQGSVELLEGGKFVYTPKKNKVGEDSFSYVAVDEAGNTSNTATIRISIIKPLDAQTFADADASNQFLAMWMRENGLYSGQKMAERLCFAADLPVTRGEFLVMTMELAGIRPEVGLTDSGFVDQSDAPAWQQPYLCSAMRRGIVRGTSTDDGLLFQPNEPITAAQAAAILCRTFRISQAMSVSADADSGAVPAWAESSVAALRNLGIDVPMDADAVIDREAAARLLYEISSLG